MPAHAEADLPGHAPAFAVPGLVSQVERVAGVVDIICRGDDPRVRDGHLWKTLSSRRACLVVGHQAPVVAVHDDIGERSQRRGDFRHGQQPRVLHPALAADLDGEGGVVDADDFAAQALQIKLHPPGAAAQVERPPTSRPAHDLGDGLLLQGVPLGIGGEIPADVRRPVDVAIFTLDDLHGVGIAFEVGHHFVPEGIPVNGFGHGSPHTQHDFEPIK